MRDKSRPGLWVREAKVAGEVGEGSGRSNVREARKSFQKEGQLTVLSAPEGSNKMGTQKWLLDLAGRLMARWVWTWQVQATYTQESSGSRGEVPREAREGDSLKKMWQCTHRLATLLPKFFRLSGKRTWRAHCPACSLFAITFLF